jgi:hypothetical protein
MKKLLALFILLAAPAFAQVDIGNGGAVNLSTSGASSVGTAGQVQMVGSTAGSFAASSITAHCF